MARHSHIEQLFKDSYLRLYSAAFRMLHDEATACDVVQDVFVQLLNSPYSDVVTEAYALRAVRNKALNALRHLDVKRRVALLLPLDNQDENYDVFAREERLRRIENVIATEVNVKGREVISLRFSQGLSFAEVAEIMQMSQNSVFRYLRNALAIIREKLNASEQ